MSWQDDIQNDPVATPAPIPAPQRGGIAEGYNSRNDPASRVAPAVQAQRDAEGVQVVASADNPDTPASADIASGGPNDIAALRRAIAIETAKGPKAAKSVAVLADQLNQKVAAPGPGASGNPWDNDPIAPAPAVVPLHGAAAIPQADAGIHVPAADHPVPVPTPEPSLSQKVIGGIEAGLNIATSLTSPANPYQPTTKTGKEYAGVAAGAAKTVAAMPGQILGTAGGTIGGIAGAIATGQYGTQQGVQNVEQSATEGAQLLTPQALAPSTPAQEAGAEGVGDVMNAAAPLMGHAPELASLHASATPVTRMVGDTAASVASKAAELPGAAARSVGKMVLDPELAKVAQIGQELPYPIKIAPDQVTQSKAAKAVGNVSRDVPLSGSPVHDNTANFTRNVIDVLNPDETAERLTPQTYADAMNRSGQGIGDIAAKTPVPLEDIGSQLEALRDSVDEKHSAETAKTINAYVNELQGAADENGMIDGTKLKSINSEIGERIRSEAGSPLGGQLDNLQDIIQDGVEKNIADPADLKALKDYRRQYAYGKILQPIVAKTVDGLVSPSSLMQAVTRTGMGKNLMALGKGGPIGDLAKVGQLIKEPGSGLIHRGAVTAVAGGLAHLEPHTAAASYGAANLYNRLGPKITRAMVGKREVPPPEVPPGPPPEPTTSPGAGGGGGGASPAGPGPLGDLTPDWQTTPGAGGGPPRGGHEPGLVPSIDEPSPTTGNRKAPLQVPAVAGRPDLPDTMVTGGPAETAATEPANAAMNEPGAIEARRQMGGRETPAQGPSIAEAQRLLAENPSPEVRKVLEDHIEAAKQLARDRAAQEAKDAQAAQIERTARTTTDPAIQKKLLDQADKLRGTERIPVGATSEGQPEIPSGAPTKPLPTGKVIEGEPKPEPVPAGKAAERTMTEDEWKTQFKLGDQDAERAKAVAQALQHDAEAVERAAVQHENSPRAFDRVIADINEKGAAHANEAQPAAEGSEGVPNEPGPAEGPREAVRADTEGTAPVRDQPAAEPVPAAERNAEGNAQPEPAAAVRGADEHAGAERVPEAGRGGVSATGTGRQDTGQQEGASGLKGPEQQTEAEFGAPRQAAHIIELEQELADAKKGKLQTGAFSAYKSKADAVRKITEALDRARNDKPERYASDHLAEINRAVREGKTPSPENVKRYQLEQPDDTTAARPAEPSDLRGQGQTPLKGEASDEAFKLAEQEKTPFTSAEALEAHLRSELGNKLIDGLQAQGLLKSENSAIEGRRARGMMSQPNADLTDMSNTHATLYWDRLSPETAAGTLMHELGEHFGVIRLLGAERYRLLLNEVKQFGKNTDPEIQAAWNDVKDRYVLKPTDKGDDQFMGGSRANPLKYEDTNDLKFLREVAAHLVETKPDLPFVRRLVNDVRVFFYTHFGTTLGTSVDANLLRGLAASALRKASEGKLEGQTAAAKPVPVAKSYAPMVAKRSDGFPPLYTR